MRLLVLSLALVAGCAQSQPTTPDPIAPGPASPDSSAVAWGSSFGMCDGYCNASLVVENGTATFSETTRNVADPPLVQTREITAEEEARLAEALSITEIVTETIGCPDCADGGAETLTLNGETLTFEFGRDAGGATALAETMRAIVRGFPGRR